MHLLGITLDSRVLNCSALREIKGEDGLLLYHGFGFPCLLHRNSEDVLTVDPITLRQHLHELIACAALSQAVYTVTARCRYKSRATDDLPTGVYAPQSGKWLTIITKQERETKKRRKRARYQYCVEIHFETQNLQQLFNLDRDIKAGCFSVNGLERSEDPIENYLRVIEQRVQKALKLTAGKIDPWHYLPTRG